MVIYAFMENSAPWVDCDTWNPLNRVLNREKLAAIEIATMYIEESSFSFKLGGSRRQPMGASAPFEHLHSRWSLDFVKKRTIREIRDFVADPRSSIHDGGKEIMSTDTATSRWNPASSDQRIGLAVGQRFFPQSPKTVMEEERATPPSEFVQGIIDKLHGRMTLFETAGRHASYGDLLDDVLSSVRVVEQAVKEFRQFLRKIAETNLVIDQREFDHDQLRGQTFQRACQEFLEESRIWDNLPYPKISAKREASRSMPQHDAEHVRELETLLREFAQLVERTLDRLVSQQLVGVVQWGTSDSCDFHFFNTVVVQRVHHRHTVRRELHSQVVHDDHLYTQRETAFEDIQRIQGESEYRHARTNIYLRDATVKPINYVEHRIPDKFAQLAGAVPDWLRDETTLIEGLRCSEEMFVSTTKQESFDIQDGPATVWYRSTFTENSPEGWRVLDAVYDPTIVIGNVYAVAGWGPKEEEAHEEEQAKARAKSVRAHRAEHLRGWRRAARYGGVTLVLLGLLLIVFSRLNPRVMLSLGSLMALASLSLLGVACRIGATFQGDTSWDSVLFGTATAGSAIMGVYFLGLGAVAGSLPVAAVGGLGLIVATAMTVYRPTTVLSK
jgi:hypothetical protein